MIIILAILKDADLNTVSSKKVRKQLEDKLEIDLSDRYAFFAYINLRMVCCITEFIVVELLIDPFF